MKKKYMTLCICLSLLKLVSVNVVQQLDCEIDVQSIWVHASMDWHRVGVFKAIPVNHIGEDVRLIEVERKVKVELKMKVEQKEN